MKTANMGTGMIDRKRTIRHTGFVILAATCASFTQGCTKDGLADNPPMLFNFHAIEDGRAYRSSQLSGEALAWVIDRYGIQTVINLRGHNPGKEWYEQEVQVSNAKNIALVNISMSSQSLPHPDLLESIVQALRTSQYPIMIHCESGSDRSGAVAGLYRLIMLEQDRPEALSELSSKYWHFQNKKPCMSKLVEIYEPTAEWMEWYRAQYQEIACQ
jgi:protein tyrosine/serine phosphatase